MKWRNSDIPKFQYKVTLIFHLKEKCFADFVSESSEHLQITRRVYWTKYCIVLHFSMQHFGELGVNLSLKSIYMNGERGLKKHTHIHTYM